MSEPFPPAAEVLLEYIYDIKNFTNINDKIKYWYEVLELKQEVTAEIEITLEEELKTLEFLFLTKLKVI